MAQNFQFYKGEDIKCRIVLSETDIDITSNTKCALLVYPENIDFSDKSSENMGRVKAPAPVMVDGNIEFTIPFFVTMTMEPAYYTVEFIIGDGSVYGTDMEGTRNIFRFDKLFALVDGGPVIKSAYSIVTPTN